MPELISARILALVASGSSLEDAVDSVLGAGTYRKLAADLYAAFRQRAAGR